MYSRLVAVLLLTIAFAGLPAASYSQGAAADAELQRGIRHVDEGDFERGIRVLNNVVTRLKASGDKAKELSRAYLYLGIAHLQLSEEQAARARFADAARTDESLSLNTYEFSPAVIEAFERARKTAAERGTRPPPAPAAPRVSSTDFIEAAKAGDVAAVRKMAQQDPGVVNTARDEEFQATALHWAALRGHAPVAAVLMGLGADVTAENKDGETPQDVARRSKRSELVAILDPGDATPPPRRPAPAAPVTLFDAAKAGDAAQVEARLKAEPRLASVRDTAFGATALHWAALRGHTEVVRVLLKAGADPGAFNNAGETPVDVARRAERPEVMKLLTDAPRSPSSLLVEAVRAGDAAAAKQVLTQSPRAVNEADATFGATPLHWAALKGYTDLIELLLERGADRNARNKSGETPLDVAQRSGRDEAARILAR